MPTRTSLRLMDLVFAAATEKIFEKGLLPGWFSTHFYMNKVISGNKLAKITLQQLKTHIQQLNAEPSLGICLVGDSPASHSYVSRKLKACDEIGIRAHLHYFPYHTAQKALISHISGMQQDGILVQLPLPPHMDTYAVIDAIPSHKDVDCLNTANFQKLLRHGELNEMLPCTPAAVLAILDSHEVSLRGKRVAMIGRSNLVGLPLSLLLMKRNATVTICHRQTENLEETILDADIVISAAGKANLVRDVKEGAIVIDVGINKGSEKKVVGDVDFDSVSKKAGLITPVPGGVGPMTVCMLMRNVFHVWCKQNGVPIKTNPRLDSDYLLD